MKTLNFNKKLNKVFSDAAKGKDKRGAYCYANDDGTFTVGTQYVAVKVDVNEYREFLFPIFGDSGNWHYEQGKKTPNNDRVFDRYFAPCNDAVEINRVPAAWEIFGLECYSFYAKEKGFVSFANKKYLEGITAAKYMQEAPKTAIRCFNRQGALYAVIMPCMGDANIKNATIAYFS